MTTSNGSPVSIRRCKDSVTNWHFRAKYIDTQIKCFFYQDLTEFDKLSYGFVIEKSPTFKETSPRELLKVFQSYKCFHWIFKCFTNCFIRSSKLTSPWHGYSLYFLKLSFTAPTLPLPYLASQVCS